MVTGVLQDVTGSIYTSLRGIAIRNRNIMELWIGKQGKHRNAMSEHRTGTGTRIRTGTGTWTKLETVILRW